jgi:hypothetical protein
VLSAPACSSNGGAETSSGGTTAATGGATNTALGGAAAVSSGGATTGGAGTISSGGAASGGLSAMQSGGSAGSGAGATSGGAIGMGGSAQGGRASGTGGAGGKGGKGTTTNGGGSGAGGKGTSSNGGAASGGGGAGSTPTCGTAAEDASVALSCPKGQIIDSVVFASYGTPSGTCGAFATGTCDATTSKSMIESQCVGRNACTVTAGNGTFGDPCHNVTKQLAVEVSCVVGEPTAPTNSPYKGIANSPAAQIAALGATWCYNWGTTPKSSDCADPYFVPMIWGSGDVAKALQGIGSAGYKTVLGFNEPNKTDQSNISVADAIALWPQLTSNPDIRVGSPAVSDDGRAWLEDFMKQAKAKGLRVDFVSMHWYGWNKGSCTASQFEGAVNWASQWGLPVWVTEWGCMGSSNPDEKTVLDFFNAAVPMLAKHPLVERYAWYPWNTYNEVYSSGASPMQTTLGAAFAAAPQYRQ